MKVTLAPAIAVLALALLGASLAAQGQPGTTLPRIGVLSGNVPENDRCLETLRRGLAELGYAEGRTHVLEVRWAAGAEPERFRQLATDLVGLKVALIVSFTGAAVGSDKKAITTVPIVMAASLYPVEQGLVASLARPGGNITGLSTFPGDLFAKRLQLLKEAVPAASRVAVLRIPGALTDLIVKDLQRAAQGLGIRLQIIEVTRAEDLPKAFETAFRGGTRAVMTTQAPFFALHRAQIAELALKYRLASLSGEQLAAEAGTLLFYGPHILEGCHRAAWYADRILMGADPGDLPIEQPTKIELVVNLKTAKALGLTLPRSILARADRLIE